MNNVDIYEFLREGNPIVTNSNNIGSVGIANSMNSKINNSKAIEEKDVNFYDYDGILLYAYSKNDFLKLSKMPANPSHERLTAQGWNWSLSDAKEYVSDYEKLNIGQMYITDDGKTRLYIHLDEGRLSPALGFGIDGSIDVDWGDGSSHTTMIGNNLTTLTTERHIYSKAGNYTIELDVAGEFSFIGTSEGSFLLTKDDNGPEAMVYRNALKKIELGKGITNIESYSFYDCRSLTSITMPLNIIDIGSSAFQYCTSLKSIIIPLNVEQIRSATFSGCSSLTLVIITHTVEDILDNAFYECISLTGVIMPPIEIIGESAFCDCVSLANITIPSSVGFIGNYAFSGCCGLGSIKFEGENPPTVQGNGAWEIIPQDCIVYVPEDSRSEYRNASNMISLRDK